MLGREYVALKGDKLRIQTIRRCFIFLLLPALMKLYSRQKINFRLAGVCLFSGPHWKPSDNGTYGPAERRSGDIPGCHKQGLVPPYWTESLREGTDTELISLAGPSTAGDLRVSKLALSLHVFLPFGREGTLSPFPAAPHRPSILGFEWWWTFKTYETRF